MASSAVHGAVLVVLFVVRGPAALVVPGPDVVQVALMDPGATVAPVPPPPQVEAPKPEPKPVEIKPEDDTGVKLQPEKKKKPEPKPRDDTPPPPMSLPSAPAGASGLKGDVAVDAANFEFTYYLVLVRNKIASNWAPPAGLVSTGQKVRAVVYFKIARGGELGGVRLESASGAEFFDRSALRAVMLSDPLPPLPLGYPSGDLGVHFGFDWAGP